MSKGSLRRGDRSADRKYAEGWERIFKKEVADVRPKRRRARVHFGRDDRH